MYCLIVRMWDSKSIFIGTVQLLKRGKQDYKAQHARMAEIEGF